MGKRKISQTARGGIANPEKHVCNRIGGAHVMSCSL
jgi:putative hemolysin